MSLQSKMTISGTVGGVNFNGKSLRNTDGQIGHEPTLAASFAGTLSTRTDDNDGVITITDDNDIESGDLIDVFWSSGYRLGMSVASVVGDAYTVEDGANASGDALPAEDSELVAAPRRVIDTDFNSALLVMLAAYSPVRCRLAFVSGTDTIAYEVVLAAAELLSWVDGQSQDNPMSGSITRVEVSPDSTTAQKFQLGIAYSSAS